MRDEISKYVGKIQAKKFPLMKEGIEDRDPDCTAKSLKGLLELVIPNSQD